MTQNVEKLQNDTVQYRDHTIRLIFRPVTNDWRYEVNHTTTIHMTNIAARYETALRKAKRDVDIMLGTKP